jgi:hypothetical protein
MASTLNPFGILPVWHPSGEIRSTGYRSTGSADLLIPSGTNVNIYKGQPVKLIIGSGSTVNGVTVPTGSVVIGPVTGTSDKVAGIFAGVEFYDATNKPTVLDFWPASQTLFAGQPQTVYLWDDPEIIYRAQMDGQYSVGGALGYSLVGKQVNISLLSVGSVLNGSTLTGLSQGAISQTAVATSSQGQFRIVKVFDPNVNTTADLYPVYEIKTVLSPYIAAQTSV